MASQSETQGRNNANKGDAAQLSRARVTSLDLTNEASDPVGASEKAPNKIVYPNSVNTLQHKIIECLEDIKV